MIRATALSMKSLQVRRSSKIFRRSIKHFHQITGELLSDLVCTTCKHVSPTFEPFKDLSLDLSFDMNGQPKSLINCLERFTRLEHLGANAKLTCSKCKTEQEFTKELSIETLPIIASFHLKRFEQTGLVSLSEKKNFL
jgi:ubiquitin carboxyl-terminal hydrolase 22/27/51